MSESIKRYSIYWADLNLTQGGEINKIRPVVVISQEEMNHYLDTIVVCPITTTLHMNWRSRIPIMCGKQKSEIAVDQIRTISKRRIKKYISRLTPSESEYLRQVINEMYGCS